MLIMEESYMYPGPACPGSDDERRRGGGVVT